MFRRSKKEIWDEFEQRIPGIKDIFETYVVSLRVSDYLEAFTTVSYGRSNCKEPFLRCHLYSSLSHKIFSLYYNINTDEMYVRNQLNEIGRLKTSSDKIPINSINHLRELLQQTVINQ